MAGLEGARLGAYELIERIGRGGMAEVYRAKQTTAFGREVAVKVIRQGFSDDQLFRERFLREAQAIAKLSHPHILPLIEFGEQDGTLYLVMPYFTGGTLRDLLTRVNGPLPLTDAIEIFTQLCDAVQYAHEQGIIHRDIKPQNVLIQRGKHLLLADFGIAREAGDPKLTLTGAGIGTVEYMAPEQAMGRSDIRSDLYSLGGVLYQMLTGHIPFSGNTPFEVMMKQANQPLTPARSLNPALPREVDGILEIALAKDPDKRFQSAAAMLHAVQSLLQPARGVTPVGQVDTGLETRVAPNLNLPAAARPGPPSSPDVPLRDYDTPHQISGGEFPPPPPHGTRPSGPSRPGWSSPSSPNWGDEQPARSSRPSTSGYGSRGGSSGAGSSPSHPGIRRAGIDPPLLASANPRKHSNAWLLAVAAILIIAALGIGSIVLFKLNNTGGTATVPAITQTTTSATRIPEGTTTPTTPARPSYAFMSQFQVFVSIHGQTPKQFTHLPKVGQPNPGLSAGFNYAILASPLLFSPDGRYIAGLIQIIDAPRDNILGGNLYIIDTTTGKVIQPTEPGSSKPLFSQGGYNSLSWKDNHTLIIAGDPSTTHVRAYNILTDSYTIALNPAEPPAGSVIVRGHYIFYSDQAPRGDGSYNLLLHRYDMNTHTDQRLFTLGQIVPFEGPVPSPDGAASFDISPDGSHILWRKGKTDNTFSLWYARISGSDVTQLLNGIDLGNDIYANYVTAISPDGKKALIQTTDAVYTVNLDGSNLQKYSENGLPDWLPDSSGITISFSTDTTGLHYRTSQCDLNTGNCSSFLSNASNLSWQKLQA